MGVRTLQPDIEHFSQKHMPTGFQRMQLSAARVVWFTISGVVMLPL
jgi:hypothetical protein